MQVCTHCGRASRDDHVFCQHCGQRLGGAPRAESALPADAPGGWVWPSQRVTQRQQVAGDLGDTLVRAAVRPGVSGGVAKMESVASAAGRLVLTSDDGVGDAREFFLDGRNVTIGRAPACTISLPDDQLASRLHAMLHFTGEHYTISDLGSSNGTLVNGALIQGAMPLAEGDRIAIGEHVITFSRQPTALSAGTPAPRAQAAPADATPADPAPAAAADDQPASAVTASAGLPQGWSTFISHPPTPQAWPPEAAEDASSSPADAAAEPATAPLPATSGPSENPWAQREPPPWPGATELGTWSPPAKPPDAAAESDSVAPASPPAASAADEGEPPESGGSRWSIEADGWNDGAAAASNGAGWWSPPATSSAPAAPDKPAVSEQIAAAEAVAWESDAGEADHGPATGEMEALRTQLVRSSEQLARWSQSATTHTRQLRGELTELANDLAAALAGTEWPDTSLDELVKLAEDAARDPHHVNTVVALANRSSELAQALAAQSRLASALRRAQERLTELAKQG